jgi:hypothetical protein
MSLVVRKMPVPTIEPTVSRAPSQVLKPRTSVDSRAGRGVETGPAPRLRSPGFRTAYFFSVKVITACVLPLEEETITLASRLPSALLPVTVPPVWPLVV